MVELIKPELSGKWIGIFMDDPVHTELPRDSAQEVEADIGDLILEDGEDSMYAATWEDGELAMRPMQLTVKALDEFLNGSAESPGGSENLAWYRDSALDINVLCTAAEYEAATGKKLFDHGDGAVI